MASFVLGMGVSIAACYIFLALVLAPGLIQGGINPIAAHLFILYCGLWSFITPPVALSAFAAAGLAGADPMRTGFTAMRLGVAKYLLPFFFVLSPALILQGSSVFESLITISFVALGLILLSISFEGYMWGIGKVGLPNRILIFSSGLLISYPEPRSTTVGISIGLLVIGILIFKRINEHKLSVSLKVRH